MEHPVPQRAAKAKLRQEAEKQDERARALDRGRAAQDIADEAHKTAVAVGAERLRDHHALPQADLTPQGEEEQTGDGHKAEAADLDQDQDHGLPEHGPVRAGIDADEARHAGSGGRRKKACQKVRRPAAPGRGGQAQKACAKQDHSEKHQNDQPSGLHRPERAADTAEKR